jgi:hypothetical protein
MKKKYNDIITRHYDSVLAFVNYIEKGKTQPQFESYPSSLSENDERWYGTKSMQQAQSLMSCGDTETQKKIEANGVAKTRLKLNGAIPRRTLFANVNGVLPHVPNYIAGVPCSMIDCRQKRKPASVLNVFYNCSVSCGVSVNDIVKATAKMISACMEIEAGGTRINMYVGEISVDDGQYMCCTIKIKNAGQPFNTLKMSYPLCNPSMLRRHLFRWLEVTPGFHDGWDSGYGRPIESAKTASEVLEQENMKMDCVLNYYNCSMMTKEEISKHIFDEYNKNKAKK